MNLRLTLATAARVGGQLRADPRTVAVALVLPCALLGIVAWMFSAQPQVLDRYGPMLVGIFPLLVMFLVTSVATLRERQSGTLERLMTTPLGRGDFIAGYALAFAGLALVQSVVVVAFALAVGMDVAGPLPMVVVVGMLDAVLGCCLGLGASSLARTEFQAVQLMPVVLLPQFLTCGLLMPREQMPGALQWLATAMPLTYAVEVMTELAGGATAADVAGRTAVIAAFIVGAVAVGVATLRRRTP